MQNSELLPTSLLSSLSSRDVLVDGKWSMHSHLYSYLLGSLDNHKSKVVEISKMANKNIGQESNGGAKTFDKI